MVCGSQPVLGVRADPPQLSGAPLLHSRTAEDACRCLLCRFALIIIVFVDFQPRNKLCSRSKFKVNYGCKWAGNCGLTESRDKVDLEHLEALLLETLGSESLLLSSLCCWLQSVPLGQKGKKSLQALWIHCCLPFNIYNGFCAKIRISTTATSLYTVFISLFVHNHSAVRTDELADNSIDQTHFQLILSRDAHARVPTVVLKFNSTSVSYQCISSYLRFHARCDKLSSLRVV